MVLCSPDAIKFADEIRKVLRITLNQGMPMVLMVPLLPPTFLIAPSIGSLTFEEVNTERVVMMPHRIPAVRLKYRGREKVFTKTTVEFSSAAALISNLENLTESKWFHGEFYEEDGR